MGSNADAKQKIESELYKYGQQESHLLNPFNGATKTISR